MVKVLLFPNNYLIKIKEITDNKNVPVTKILLLKEGNEMAGENNSNTPAVQGSKKGLDQLKNEVANELGATLGGDRTSRENGSVGGYMTKKMVQFAEQQLKSGQKI